MRVLVTGHNGYLGSVMAAVLHRRGYEIAGLDTYYYEECTFGPAGVGIPSVRKDIRDVTAEDLSNFEAVIHLAALSNDPLGELKGEWTTDINYTASVRLAREAKRAGVRRFLFASSCSMYGASGAAEATEEDPLQPLTQYASSKVRTERDVSALAGDNFSPVFMRNATVYGVSPKLRQDLVLNNLVGWAHATGKVLIMSDGTPWRPIVHVEDVAEAFAEALAAPREAVHNQAINVGRNSENYRVRDIADIVQEVVPGSRIEYAAQAAPDQRNYRVNFQKLERVLPNFRPRWDARQGARQLYEAFLEERVAETELFGRKYTRLKQLRHLIEGGWLDGTLRWRIPRNEVARV